MSVGLPARPRPAPPALVSALAHSGAGTAAPLFAAISDRSPFAYIAKSSSSSAILWTAHPFTPSRVAPASKPKASSTSAGSSPPATVATRESAGPKPSYLNSCRANRSATDLYSFDASEFPTQTNALRADVASTYAPLASSCDVSQLMHGLATR